MNRAWLARMQAEHAAQRAEPPRCSEPEDNAPRGVGFSVLFAVPLWALIALFVWAVLG